VEVNLVTVNVRSVLAESEQQAGYTEDETEEKGAQEERRKPLHPESLTAP
jgi:hypothetical protein